MNKIKNSKKITRRSFLKTTAAAALAYGTIGGMAPIVLGKAKKFKGVTLNGAAFQHGYHMYLKEYLPEFEEMTGIKVNLELAAFPIYNQRADLELSTKGRAWDFMNITFIYTGRWIGAGWFENLEPYIKDPNLTPPDWDADDFMGGSMACLKDSNNNRYAFAWEGGAMIAAAGRFDIIEKSGFNHLPKTFEELVTMCAAINKKEECYAYVNDNLHHWHWIPFLHGFGGDVFKAPPGNLTPTIDTPEAIESAQYYADLLMKYSPEGILSYTMDQARVAQMTGRANYRNQAIAWLVPLAKEGSKVSKTVKYGLMPAGPKGNFPAVNSRGYGIPIGAKNKKAAWEFIKWALSKEMVKRIALEKGYTAICRKSIIEDPKYKEYMTLNGQDVASLYMKVMEMSGTTGHMAYRTVPVFPQVGDKINKAIERIATKQQTAEEAMKQAQKQAIADLRKSGIKMDI